MIDIQYKKTPLEEIAIGGTFETAVGEIYMRCNDGEGETETCVDLKTGDIRGFRRDIEVIEHDVILTII